MTTANKITIGRILLVPFFISQIIWLGKTGADGYRIGALISFALAAADGLDGFVARHFNQRSELGRVLDPLADKLLLTSAILLLSYSHNRYLNVIPVWLTCVVLGRDAILLAGVIALRSTTGRVRVQPHVTGKIATVLQMASVLWILLRWPAPALHGWILSAGIFTVLSALFYICNGLRQRTAQSLEADAPPSELNVGEMAPLFTAEKNGGGTVSLIDLRGKTVVLFFYPKDNTPVCSSQACSFRDNYSELTRRGVVVLGANPNSVESHDKFARKFKLPYMLLSDPQRELVGAYHVWGKHHFLGIPYRMTNRTTFLIDPDGRIRKIWRQVDPKNQMRDILSALNHLTVTPGEATPAFAPKAS